jgi:hypothetical protein
MPSQADGMSSWQGGATPTKYLPTGEVGIKFNLHFDGQMSDVRVVSTTVNGPFTTNYCRAMSDSAPYPAWTPEMRNLFSNDVREIRFTFFYE